MAVAVAGAASCGASSWTAKPPPDARPITTPPGLSVDEVRAATARACGIITTFAAAHGWSRAVEDCHFDSVEIYADPAQIPLRVRALHNLPEDAKLPAGIMAGLEKRVLMAVTPRVYRRLRPDDVAQPDAWARLLAHEIGHRLHVAILDGDEEAMGPTWFFEGFAVVAAGQQLGAPLSFDSPSSALASAKTGAGSAYRRYSAAVRYFMTLRPLPELVSRAGKPDFEPWLLSLTPK